MYIKSTDFTAIQSDVLTLTTEDNASIKAKYKLKTDSKIVNTAINELLNKINTVNDTAISAKSDVATISTDFEEVKIKAEAAVQWIESVESGGDEEDKTIETKIEQATQKFVQVDSDISDLQDTTESLTEEVSNATSDILELTKLINQLQSKIEELENKEVPASGIVGTLSNDEFHVSADQQTVFTLTKTPIDENQIIVYVNGIKYNNEDWDYNQEDNAIVWKNTEFELLTKHYVSVVYMSMERGNVI